MDRRRKRAARWPLSRVAAVAVAGGVVAAAVAGVVAAPTWWTALWRRRTSSGASWTHSGNSAKRLGRFQKAENTKYFINVTMLHSFNITRVHVRDYMRM